MDIQTGPIHGGVHRNASPHHNSWYARDHRRMSGVQLLIELLEGICFGHQIMARALGGPVVPNNGRWELGVYDVNLTPVGCDFFGIRTLVRCRGRFILS